MIRLHAHPPPPPPVIKLDRRHTGRQRQRGNLLTEGGGGKRVGEEPNDNALLQESPVIYIIYIYISFNTLWPRPSSTPSKMICSMTTFPTAPLWFYLEYVREGICSWGGGRELGKDSSVLRSSVTGQVSLGAGGRRSGISHFWHIRIFVPLCSSIPGIAENLCWPLHCKKGDRFSRPQPGCH